MPATTTITTQPFASEALVISTVSKALTASVYALADERTAVKAEITVEAEDIRYWKDGSTPTTTVGHLRKADTEILILDTPQEIAQFRAIRATGADSKIHVTYFR